MPGTFIDFEANIAEVSSTPDVIVSADPGQTVVVWAGSFFLHGDIATIADSGANAWEGGYMAAAGGFYSIKVWYAKITSSGLITITITTPGFTDFRVGAAVYDGLPPFDQVVYMIGAYTPSDPMAFPQGISTAAFTPADSKVITLGFSNPATVASLVSDTGDAQQATEGGVFIYDRDSQGPGVVGLTMLKGNASTAAECAILALVFSQPRARPGGLQTQFAIRPGSGEADFDPANTAFSAPAGTPETNRPLRVPFTYLPLIGSFVWVSVAPRGQVNEAAVSVEDDYGNTYTKRIYSAGAAGRTASIWTTVVTNLPPAGEVFAVLLTVSPITVSAALYQQTAIAIGEKVIAGSPTAYVAAGYLSAVDLSPVCRITSNTIVNVPVGTYIVGFAVYGGTGSQTAAAWNISAGYTKRAEATMIQHPFAGTNDPRLCSAVIFDQTAPTLDDYNAVADATIAGTYDTEGSIAILAISLIATLELVKVVVGGPSVAADFTLEADGPTPLSGAGGVAATPVDPGSYDLSENSIPGYSLSLVIAGGTQTGPASVDIAANDAVVGTFTNTYTASPCESITPEATDMQIELRRVNVTLRPAARLPVRGRS